MNQEIKNKLLKHIGWEQVSDIHQVDSELGMPPSSGIRLGLLLIENACNQTGIRLEDKTECRKFAKELGKIYD